MLQTTRAVHELHLLGIHWEDARVLLLLPAIQVAWSDGTIDPGERDLLHQYARNTLSLQGRAMTVVDRWLIEQPSRAYVAAALETVVTLVHASDVELPGLTPEVFRLAMDFAEVVAVEHPSGDGRLRDVERGALATIQAEVAGVQSEHGPQIAYEGRPVSGFWTDLLEELGNTLQPGQRRASLA